MPQPDSLSQKEVLDDAEALFTKLQGRAPLVTVAFDKERAVLIVYVKEQCVLPVQTFRGLPVIVELMPRPATSRRH